MKWKLQIDSLWPEHKMRWALGSIPTVYSAEGSRSWEDDRHSADQEITRLLLNRVHKSLPLVPILSQMNLVHTSHPVSLRSILIVSSHRRLFILRFPPEFWCRGMNIRLLLLDHAPLQFLSRTWQSGRRERKLGNFKKMQLPSPRNKSSPCWGREGKGTLVPVL